ncbi:MAG: ATP-binding protein [Saprospiraceae bacterium]|nr:ATP-binding protein [Saprospiraceae bacterium]MBK7738284.1 ATP-binding protein [Saprospiraceae bacterium]MBK7913142.1 ATP-binding protein [Saprospiraceae bacterium]
MYLFQESLVYQVIGVSFIMPILLCGILFWFIFAYQKKKLQNEIESREIRLKEQQLIIEKQESIQNERNRIASEMHDDLGSGLTTIRYLSDRALTKAASEEERTQIGRIAAQSNALIRNMSEIIWALNMRFDSLDSLLAYLRRYAAEFLEEHHIELSWQQMELNELHALSGEMRRNIHLTVKEALNNIVKHAGATKVNFLFSKEEGFFILKLIDNGTGFNPESISSDGNGLFNMQNRMKSIEGDFQIYSKPTGTEVIIRFPLSLSTA